MTKPSLGKKLDIASTKNPLKEYFDPTSGRFHELGCPVLVGHSRKRFLGKLLGDQQADRTAATVGTAMTLARQGVQIIRVHDVSPVRQALLAFEASGGIDGRPLRVITH